MTIADQEVCMDNVKELVRKYRNNMDHMTDEQKKKYHSQLLSLSKDIYMASCQYILDCITFGYYPNCDLSDQLINQAVKIVDSHKNEVYKLAISGQFEKLEQAGDDLYQAFYRDYYAPNLIELAAHAVA